MQRSIDCAACGASFKLSDAIYERRIRGQLTTLICKKCKAPIQIDDRASAPSTALSDEPEPAKADGPEPAKADEPEPAKAEQKPEGMPVAAEPAESPPPEPELEVPLEVESLPPPTVEVESLPVDVATATEGEPKRKRKRKKKKRKQKTKRTRRPRDESDGRRSVPNAELAAVSAEPASGSAHIFWYAFLVGAAAAGVAWFVLSGKHVFTLHPDTDSTSEPAVSALTPTLRTPRVEIAQADRASGFDRAQATRLLAAAAETAGMCRKIGEPEGTAYAAVTIATSGSVESVRITNAPFEGTSTGTCIAEELRKIRVSPFSGSSVVLTQSVRVR